MTQTMRAALYCRISKDDEQERLLRQEQDLRWEAERRGAVVVHVLIDNDLSGEDKVGRPAFERLIELVSARDVDLVLAADVDRLLRGFEPYVRLYEACERVGMVVAWLGGEGNFATGTGLLELDIRASFAREELRKIGSRTRRKHLELAQRGVDVAGRRPFGYHRVDGKFVIDENEAELIREAARLVLEGVPLNAIVRDWTARKVATTTGSGLWRVESLKHILASARISGRREVRHHGDDRVLVGTVTGPCETPGIITAADSDRLRALLGDPERRKKRPARSYLLTGTICCGICASRMVSQAHYPDGARRYICSSLPPIRGCGRVTVTADKVEELVTDAVLKAVDRGALNALMQPHDTAAAEELVQVDALMASLTRRLGQQEITQTEWDAAREPLSQRRKALVHATEEQRRQVGLDGLPDRLREAWPDLPFHRKRAVVGTLVETVTIAPVGKQATRFDSSRVTVRWRI